jgi:hypothetical protein
MEAIAVVVLVAVFLVLTSFVVFASLEEQTRRRRRRDAQWRAAAAELGLAFTRKEEDLRLHGVLEGVPLRADLMRQIEGKSSVLRCALRVGRGGQIPASLVVRSDSVLRSMGRLIEGEDQQIGDPKFDQQVELPALDAWACAALSCRAREQLAQLVVRGGEVGQGMVVCDQIWDDEQDQKWLLRMLRWLVQLAHLLSVTPDSLHERLADNARNDPNPGVRLQNLRFLADSSTRAPAPLLLSLGRSLLADVNPSVRLVAAQFAGVEGHRVLGALAADAELATPLRVLAVNALGKGATPAVDVLSALFTEAHPPELVCAALAVVAGRGLSALTDAAVACTRNAEPSVRAAAAHTLGALARQQAEPQLIGLLSDESVDVRQASAEALGLIGSVAAVEPLLPLAEGLGRPQLRRAARGAIGRIQSRLGNVEAGRVSLVRDQELAGAVDLADSADSRVGELSLAEEGSLRARRQT